MVYDFGLRLKELRQARHLSQDDVARRLDLTRSTISGYECNTIVPSLEHLIELAILYNTSLDYLTGLEHRPNFYLDDLTESQQKTILEVVALLKKEYLKR